MKRIVIVLLILLVPALVSAQTFLSEDFSRGVPPNGWSADSHSANWHSGSSNEAGGSVPELVFDWDPQFNGTTRFMSPRVDLTGVTGLKIEFKYNVDHYGGAYTIGIATRAGNGSWHNVWTIVNPSNSIPATTEVVNINNSDVGAADFQICWFFTGNSYNINYWYLDDFVLFQPMDHDARIKSIVMDSQYQPGSMITPRGIVENFGLNEETFDATCEINLGGSTVYSETVSSINLPAGSEETVDFPVYTASQANDLYEVTMTTVLDGDENEGNDSMTRYFNTYTTERDMVILEIGTGTWCQYCPGSAMGADDLIENGHDVGVVEYHYNDPFQNSNGLSRIAYYGISGYPTAVFDGVVKFIGGSQNQSMYSNYLPIYQARHAINSAFVLDIFGENQGYDYDVTVTIDKMATIPPDWVNMAAYMVLTESDISYNWYGQDHLNFVERAMSPNSDGTPVSFDSGDHLEIPLQFTLNNSWVYENCELVVFIQNLDNKEILQGMKKALPDLTPLAVDDDNVELPLVTELKGNYPNPFNPQTNISFTLANPGDVTIEVYNVIGQKVRTLLNQPMDAGEHSVVWDGANENGHAVASGVYFYKLQTENFSSTKKMLMLK